MPKKTPSSMAAMKIGRKRYMEERERHREKLRRRREAEQPTTPEGEQ
jgi:hypothetical protein